MTDLPQDPFGDDDTTIHADACTAIGVAVLDALVGGAIAVTVMANGEGGYLVAPYSGEDER